MDSVTTLLSEEITQRIGWVLVHFLWQGCVIMMLAWCVFKAFGKASSNIRYLTACIGLGLMAVVPVLTFMAIRGGQGVVIAPEKTAVKTPVVENVRPSVPTQAIIITSAEPAASESLRKILTARLEAALPYCVSSWIVGVTSLSLWYLGGWCQLQRLRRQMVKQATPALKAKLQQLSNALDIQKAIGLVESAMVQVPTVIGHLKPVIIMPASALTGLSPEQIEAILAHELAHIKRCDYLVNLLQTVVEILGFYHPAVWWVSHKIRIERENCCDDIAVSLCRDRVCYAKALTMMEEIRSSQPALAVAASGGILFDRIRRLLGKDHANDTKKSWLVPVASILTITFIFVSISCQRSQKSVPMSSWNSKIERLDIDKAGRNDVIKIFGEPIKYVWGMQQVFDKNALPACYVMVYPGNFHVFVINDRVIEVRFENPSDYVFGNGLIVGSSIEKAFSVLGQPVAVVDGKPNDFKDDVFYKNIDGKKGYGYYARPDKNIRIWTFDNKVKAIYLTRSNYSAGGGIELTEAELPETSFIDENDHIVDKVDYPFVNDPEVIGGWKSVDFIQDINDFDLDKKNWPDELYLNHLIFEEGGNVAGNLFKWTKGLVLSEDTASKYTIKTIKDSQYMFYEWKSGDYTIRHRKPHYYVLKKDSAESLKIEPMFGKKADIPPTSTINEKGYIVDKIDYPFINDPEVIGTWKSVDFVDKIEQFQVGEKHWKGRGGKLFLHEMIFEKDGKLISKNDKLPNGFPKTWTNGLVLYNNDTKTASKYIIKERNGSKYMFYEWKSGDYTFRRMKPAYYVLKKVETSENSTD